MVAFVRWHDELSVVNNKEKILLQIILARVSPVLFAAAGKFR